MTRLPDRLGKFRSMHILPLLILIIVSLPALAGVRLNNLVTELLRVEVVQPARRPAFTFDNPRDGWIYVRLRADVRGPEKVELLRNGAVWLEITAQAGPIRETMR